MEIGLVELSTGYQTSKLLSDVSMAVLDKSLDSLETAGVNFQKMLEASVTPNLGQNFDISI